MEFCLGGREQGTARAASFDGSILRFNTDYLLHFIINEHGHDYGIHDGASFVILSISCKFQFTFIFHVKIQDHVTTNQKDCRS